MKSRGNLSRVAIIGAGEAAQPKACRVSAALSRAPSSLARKPHFNNECSMKHRCYELYTATALDISRSQIDMPSEALALQASGHTSGSQEERRLAQARNMRLTGKVQETKIGVYVYTYITMCVYFGIGWVPITICYYR